MSGPATQRKATRTSTSGFTTEERAAMRARNQELKAAARRGKAAADGEADLLARIAEMAEPDRRMAERVHAVITSVAADLTPRTWYGMPAYAKDDAVVCFFQSAGKFKSRYAMLGFSDTAQLDEGDMWPTYFALKEMTAATEEAIAALVRRAVG